MNTDIRISTSFLNHRKRKKLQSILGHNSTSHLIDLWLNTAMNKPDGVLVDMDVADIALEANWIENPNTFVDAMVKSRLLDVPSQTCEWYRLHDWKDHQPWASNASDRSVKAAKNQAFRWCIAEVKKKEDKEKFRVWYYEIHTFIKGSNRDAILSEYDSYTKCNTPILSSPILSSPKDIKQPLSAGFDVFWKEYPKKKEKKKSLEIWKRKKLHTKSAELVADVIQRKTKDRGWLEGYILNPTTYLNGDRWEDAIEQRTTDNKGLEHISELSTTTYHQGKKCGECDKWIDTYCTEGCKVKETNKACSLFQRR